MRPSDMAEGMESEANGFLGSLSTNERAEVIAAMTSHRFTKGETVFHQGDQGFALHIVNRGHFIVHALSRQGEETALVVLGPGDVFGEMAVVGSQQTRTATVRSLDNSATLGLDRQAVEELRTSSANVDRLLLEIMTSTVIRLTERQMELTELTAPERIRRRLVELLGPYPSGTIRLVQSDIAGLCKTSRATVNATLAELSDAGIVSQRGHAIIIDDPDALRRRVPLL